MARLITFASADDSDFERLLDLRVRVMRAQLERIGRFDPARARARFREGFVPAHARLILVDGAVAGCVSLVPGDDGLELMHFYLEPALQGAGIGGEVLRRLCAEADARGLPVRLEVLKHSPARRLYERHGFVFTHDDQWDDFLRRPVLGSHDRNRPGE